MKNKSIPISLWIGLIVCAATTGIFFLMNSEITDIKWIGFAFAIFSELLFFGGLVLIGMNSGNKDKIILNTAFTVPTFIYLIAAVFLMIFAENFETYKKLLIIEIILAAVVLIFIIATVSFSGRRADADKALFHSRGFMLGCEKKALDMYSNASDEEYKDALYKLYETCKYSDNVGDSSVDYRIGELFSSLENALLLTDDLNKTQAVTGVISELEDVLAKRKSELLAYKRGGF